MQKSNILVKDIDYTTHIAPALPHDQGSPQINGAAVYGASLGKDFLYLIPVTGQRPLRFSAVGLPAGLSLDELRGIISGRAVANGTYKVAITVSNACGEAHKELTLKIGENALAQTPVMGWNSWNCFREQIDDEKIRRIAQSMIDSGLAARGYSYVNLDSNWQSTERGGEYNSIIPSEAFPDMHGLCDFIHSLGLKAGIYSSPFVTPWGTEGCGSSSGICDTSFAISYGKYVGMNKHEAEDVRQWCEWGFDYLKYDWVVTDMILAERMSRELRQSSRDMIYSLVTDVNIADAAHAARIANSYRSNRDTDPGWQSIKGNGFDNDQWNPYIAPGHWFDLDMLATTPRNGFELSRNELISHISCWMMRPSPILIDCDPGKMDDFMKSLLCNEEIIAINQDELGKPSASLFHNAVWDIRIKPLADGNCAVAFFNNGGLPALAPNIGLVNNVGRGFKVRDLWSRQDLGEVGDDFIVAVAPHCAKVYKIFVPPTMK